MGKINITNKRYAEISVGINKWYKADETIIETLQYKVDNTESWSRYDMENGYVMSLGDAGNLSGPYYVTVNANVIVSDSRVDGAKKIEKLGTKGTSITVVNQTGYKISVAINEWEEDDRLTPYYTLSNKEKSSWKRSDSRGYIMALKDAGKMDGDYYVEAGSSIVITQSNVSNSRKVS